MREKMMPQRHERPGYPVEFWWLIHLESELMMTAVYLRLFGSLPEGKATTDIAYWAGYEYTLQRLEPRAVHSVRYADVAASVRAMAAGIDEKDWLSGCQQAAFELSLTDDEETGQELTRPD